MNITTVLAQGLDLIIFVKGVFHLTVRFTTKFETSEKGRPWRGTMAKLCWHSWDPHNLDWIPVCLRDGALVLDDSGVDIDLADI